MFDAEHVLLPRSQVILEDVALALMAEDLETKAHRALAALEELEDFHVRRCAARLGRVVLGGVLGVSGECLGRCWSVQDGAFARVFWGAFRMFWDAHGSIREW